MKKQMLVLGFRQTKFFNPGSGPDFLPPLHPPVKGLLTCLIMPKQAGFCRR
jgi:hypothetical protein